MVAYWEENLKLRSSLGGETGFVIGEAALLLQAFDLERQVRFDFGAEINEFAFAPEHCQLLFVPKRDHRVDPHGPARGNVGGEKGCGDQHDTDDDERFRVGGRDAVQEG